MRPLSSLLSRFLARLHTPTDIDDECPPETESEHEALLAAVYAQLQAELPPGAITCYPGTDIPCADLTDPRVREIFMP